MCRQTINAGKTHDEHAEPHAPSALARSAK